MEEIETKKEEMVIISRPPPLLCSQLYPWLVIRDGRKWVRQIFYSITKDTYHVRFIPEMKNKYIAASCKGWLVLADNDTHECLLLNISTMKKVQLPPTDVADYRRVLSSQNIDSNCRVLFFNSVTKRFRSCYIGDSEFIEHDLLTVYKHKFDFMAAISLEGKLYIMTMEYHLLCADFTDPLLHFTTVIRGDEIIEFLPFYFEQTRHYLVESLGELFFIYKTGCDHELLDLKIYKADLGCKKWVPVEEKLGDRAIFLDAANSSVVSPASVYGLKGNSVYYVNKFGRNISVYDIEDECTTMYLPCPIASYKSALTWVYVNSAL